MNACLSLRIVQTKIIDEQQPSLSLSTEVYVMSTFAKIMEFCSLPIWIFSMAFSPILNQIANADQFLAYIFYPISLVYCFDKMKNNDRYLIYE